MVSVNDLVQYQWLHRKLRLRVSHTWWWHLVVPRSSLPRRIHFWNVPSIRLWGPHFALLGGRERWGGWHERWSNPSLHTFKRLNRLTNTIANVSVAKEAGNTTANTMLLCIHYTIFRRYQHVFVVLLNALEPEQTVSNRTFERAACRAYVWDHVVWSVLQHDAYTNSGA